MTKKERYEAIEKACDEFRRSRMMIWRTSKKDDSGAVELMLPMTYVDGDGVALFITPYHDDSGYVRVSDGGGTSFHQMLTEMEVELLSNRYHLSHGNLYGDEPPFECELYDVVKLDKIDEAIMGIIMAIQDSYMYAAWHGSVGEDIAMIDDDYKDLRCLCEVFRDTEMQIWRNGNHVIMNLPYTFSDGRSASIKTSKTPDGKIRVSDGGLIAMHEPLTPADVYEICDKNKLEYDLKDESDDLPLDCEIYKIVDRLHFCDAVLAIMKASMDARDIWG